MRLSLPGATRNHDLDRSHRVEGWHFQPRISRGAASRRGRHGPQVAADDATLPICSRGRPRPRHPESARQITARGDRDLSQTDQAPTAHQVRRSLEAVAALTRAGLRRGPATANSNIRTRRELTGEWISKYAAKASATWARSTPPRGTAPLPSRRWTATRCGCPGGALRHQLVTFRDEACGVLCRDGIAT